MYKSDIFKPYTVSKKMPAKTRQQIAFEYGICTKTLNKWMKSADIKLPKGLVNPFYQMVIHEKIGMPNYSAKSTKL